MHEPANIGGQLLRLGAGQKMAVVQGVQEAVVADPLLFIDQHLVHHGYLPCRAAEA